MRGAERFVPPHARHYLTRQRESAEGAEAEREKPGLNRPPASRRTRSDIRTEAQGRAELKAACLALLDTVAMEHPAGHGKLAARYILRSQNDDRIELMFERDAKSRANLWLARDRAGDLLNTGIEFRAYPASDLYQATEPGGKTSYGRHAALRSMRDLANADLVRFTIERAEQMEALLANLTSDVASNSVTR